MVVVKRVPPNPRLPPRREYQRRRIGKMMPRSEEEESNAQNNERVNRNNDTIRTTGFLNTPHEGTKLEFARGEQQQQNFLLARLGFAMPLFFTATLLSFVLYWGALLFPPFAVFFICAFISYGWFKGILYSFSALFIGVPRAHLYKTADWKQLGNDSRKKSPLLERTLGVSD